MPITYKKYFSSSAFLCNLSSFPCTALLSLPLTYLLPASNCTALQPPHPFPSNNIPPQPNHRLDSSGLSFRNLTIDSLFSFKRHLFFLSAPLPLSTNKSRNKKTCYLHHGCYFASWYVCVWLLFLILPWNSCPPTVSLFVCNRPCGGLLFVSSFQLLSLSVFLHLFHCSHGSNGRDCAMWAKLRCISTAKTMDPMVSCFSWKAADQIRSDQISRYARCAHTTVRLPHHFLDDSNGTKVHCMHTTFSFCFDVGSVCVTSELYSPNYERRTVGPCCL